MSGEEEFISPEDWEGIEVADEKPEIVDTFAGVQRAASIVGDLRKELRKEGFTKEETYGLVQMYWASELGAFD